MKTIFLIAGESSSGKDSLVNGLCEKYGMTQLISYTTRPRRTGEGNTHIFIKPEEISLYKNDIIASTEINGNTYFATRNQLYSCDFYIIDRNGIVLLLDKLNGEINFNFVTIYITAPFELRYKRALKRGDIESVFFNRSMSEQTQFLMLKTNNEFDYAIVNKNFDKALKVLENIVLIERGQSDK